jgi:glycosyltransferase involved in cell wall biosynthesis
MTTRILHYVDGDAFGGTERSLLQLVEGLGRRGYECSIRCHQEPELARMRDEADAKGLSIRQVRRPSGWRTPGLLCQLAREFRAFHPTILHLHMPSVLGCRDAVAAAALARVPVVIATVQLWIPQPQRLAVHLKQRLLSRFIDRYVAVSRAIAMQLSEEFHVPREKVRVVYNGTSIPPRRTTSSPATARGAVRVLTACRLHAQKGLEDLLHAVPRVSGAIFLIAGDGPDRPRLEDIARRLCIADRVRFLGFRNDVARLLDACDLFVLPSLYEGLPLVLLEAMAHERPIIATAVPGNEEVLADGAGITVPPRDPDALAAGITALASNPARARHLAAVGRERVEANFSVDRMVDGVVQVYADALGAAAVVP